MAGSQKFMFDHRFDLDPSEQQAAAAPANEAPAPEEDIEAEPEEEIPPGFSEEEMAAAKAEAFENGKQEGAKTASVTIESETLNALQSINQKLNALQQVQNEANDVLVHDATGVAAAMVKKLFPELNKEHGIEEVITLIEKTLTGLIDEARVIIKVNAGALARVNERMESIKDNSSFDGRLVIKEDAHVEPGDCIMEWGDGSADRTAAKIWQSIDEIIANNVPITKNATADTVIDEVVEDVVAPTNKAETTEVESAPAQQDVPNEPEN